jgi:aspartate aminotransferase
MSLSQVACSITESPTLRLNEEARLLRERGEPVIHLGIGEPKNKAPITAILSSAAKLSSGDVKYTPTDGLPSLKKAIIRYTEENYNRIVSPYNIIVSEGAKQSLFNIMFTLCNPQDEVIVLAPYWVSYPEIVRMVGAIPVIVTPEDGGFVPSFEEIERAVSSYTKAIIVNNPNNPSGAVYPDELVAKLVELCESKGIYLICDDIYHKLVFDGRVPAPAYKFTNRDAENTKVIVVNGVAKLYGMTGFRIGWVVAPRRMVEVMTNVQSQTTTCASPVMQAAAEGALTGMQSIVESLRLTIQNNRDVLMQELRTFTDVRCAKPGGTFYALPDFRAYVRKSIAKDSVALSDFLLKRALVVTVPGGEFGMEGHLRLSYAGSVKDITEGIERMKWALDPNAPSEIYIGDRKLVRDWL